MLPPGYIVHANDPTWMWNPTTGDMRPIPPEAVAPAAPAPAAPSGLSYGTLDLDFAMREYSDVDQGRGLFNREDGLLYIDFPKLTGGAGTSVYLLVRLLPPWAPDIKQAWVKVARHVLPPDVVPNAPEGRKVIFIDCLDTKGGPGHCPIDVALNQIASHPSDAAAEFVQRCRPRMTVYFQGINLEKPQEHFVQAVGLDGLPVLDPATGQPTWKVVPGIIRLGMEAYKAILYVIGNKKDPTHPDFGYAMKLDKEKTGPADMNVDYKATDYGEKGPIDPALRPVLNNLLDLSKSCVRFRSREELQGIANAMLAKFPTTRTVAVPATLMSPTLGAPITSTVAAHGAALPPPLPSPAGATWIQHPDNAGWEYNPATQQVRQKSAPPAAPPPVPAALIPPPIPSAAPPLPVPPTRPAVSPGYVLPPATAPGGIPSVPPPISPLPPPGMPASVSPIAPPPMTQPSLPVSPPPIPTAAPALTPEQLEAELTKIPF